MLGNGSPAGSDRGSHARFAPRGQHRRHWRTQVGLRRGGHVADPAARNRLIEEIARSLRRDHGNVRDKVAEMGAPHAESPLKKMPSARPVTVAFGAYIGTI